METERLQKVMANAGVASRRASERLITEGKVQVNGKTVKELGTKVEHQDIITVSGRVVEREKKVYYLFYKRAELFQQYLMTKGERS